jgi:hypothetical protein
VKSVREASSPRRLVGMMREPCRDANNRPNCDPTAPVTLHDNLRAFPERETLVAHSVLSTA